MASSTHIRIFNLQARQWLLLAFMVVPVTATSFAQGKALLVFERNPVVVEQAFRLTYEFENANVSFDAPPALPGIRYLNGPSTSTSTQIINGSRTSKKSYTYLAVANEAGVIEIPRLEFQSRKGVLRTEAVTLKVLARGSSATRAPSPFEAVIEVDKKSVHLGEPIRVQYKIYNRLEAVDVRGYTFPELSGVWKETVEGEDPRWESTIVDGQRVQVATVQTEILYPTRSGSLEIAGFDVQAQQRINFFNTRPISSTGRPVQIQVKPLPSDVPGHSLGTFRQLKATWKLESNEAPTTNAATNLVLEFNGKGNLPLIGAPDIEWPEDLEVFDPEIEDRITIGLQGQRGKRTMTFLLIPRAPGEFTIELPPMGYFDYDLDRYVPLSPPPVVLNVAGASDEEGLSFGFNSKSDVTILTRDMRFIRTESQLKPRTRPFFAGALHLALWMLPPFLLLLGSWRLRRKNRAEADPTWVRKKQSRSLLKTALKDARSGTGSFDSLGRAAHAYLQSQLALTQSEASMERYGLALQGHRPEVATTWVTLLTTLDHGRFAPGAPDVANLADQLEAAMRMLEQSGTNKGTKSAAPLATLVMLLAGLSPVAATPDIDAAQAQFQEGNAAYLEGDFETAIQAYTAVSEQWTSFELEYNLGVAHYKSGRIGPCILHFERAKRIRPSDDDLQANILLAQSAVVDRIEEMPEIALAPLWRELTAQHRLISWTTWSLLLWGIAFLLLLLRLQVKDVTARRMLIIAGPVLATTAVILGLLSRETFMRSKSDAGAVIMVPRVEVMSSPSEGPESSNLFILHEGTVVEILRTDDAWVQIQLSNGNTGWVHAPDLTSI